LAHYGLKESDYKMVYVGGTDARVQAPSNKGWLTPRLSLLPMV